MHHGCHTYIIVIAQWQDYTSNIGIEHESSRWFVKPRTLRQRNMAEERSVSSTSIAVSSSSTSTTYVQAAVDYDIYALTDLQVKTVVQNHKPQVDVKWYASAESTRRFIETVIAAVVCDDFGALVPE